MNGNNKPPSGWSWNKGVYNCGSHYSDKCGNCIFSEDGSYAGAELCNGDCTWDENEEKCKTKSNISVAQDDGRIRCGIVDGENKGQCPGKLYCSDWEWCGI